MKVASAKPWRALAGAILLVATSGRADAASEEVRPGTEKAPPAREPASKPVDGQSKPGDGQSKPVDGQSKPGDGQSKPGDGQSEARDGQSEAATEFSLSDLVGGTASAAASESTTPRDGGGLTSESTESSAPAPELSYGGYIFEEARVFAKALRRDRPGSAFDSWGRAYLNVDTKLDPLTKFRVSAALDVYTQSYRPDSTDVLYSLDVDEAFFSKVLGPVQLKLGSQLVGWGTMDSLSPQDQFNPYDLRFLVGKGRDTGTERVSVVAARALVSLNEQNRLDFVFVPFAQPNRAFIHGTNFALFRPGLAADLIREYLADVRSTVAPEQQPTFNRIAELVGGELYADPALQARMPTGSSLLNGRSFQQPPEGGIRFSGSAGPFDYGLSGLTAHERLPQLWLSEDLKSVLLAPGANSDSTARVLAGPSEQLQARYPRFYLAGIDLGVRFDAFALKVEGAYRNRSTQYGLDLTPFRPSLLEGAAHLEYLKGSSFAAVLEVLVSHVLDDRPLLFAHRTSARLSGRLSLALLRDLLKFRVDAAYNVQYEDFFVAPEASYDISDRVTLALGAAMFLAPRKADISLALLRDPSARSALKVGPFQYYASENFGFLKLKYGF